MRKNKISKLVSGILSAIMAFGAVPSLFPAVQTVSYAEQSSSSDYKNPAETWINTGNRASEFDLNATKTVETNRCCYCQTDTLFDIFRVPEYTAKGISAAASGILYTQGDRGYDGDEDGYIGEIAPIDDPNPSQGKFTNHHWTKSWCQKCKLFNTNLGVAKWMTEDKQNPVAGVINAAVDKPIYILYTCDSGFFNKFQTDDYQSFDEETHTSSRTVGDYCQFCKGTASEPKEVTEDHTYEHNVIAEEGHNRFHKGSTCSVCGYHMDSYMTAKSVVADYYGKVDGQPHTVEVADYSDDSVITAIKYGTSSETIKDSSAPNFTDAGSHDVWYKINYTAGVANTSAVATYDEIGCAKVILYDDSDKNNGGDNSGAVTLPDGTIIINGTIVIPPTHVHEFAYQSTVAPTESTLGYEIWQCSCGIVENRNFTPSLSTEPHTHEYVYKYTAAPTNTELGYEMWECSCGVQEKRNYKPALVEDVHMHEYTYQYTVAPTTAALGYEIWTCSCGSTEQRNYTAPVGEDTHNFVYKWSEEPTCTADGYEVWQCDSCGAIQRQNYKSKTAHDMERISTVPAGCSDIGYEVWQCKGCGMQEKKNYTPAKGHNYEKSTIREATCNQTGLDLYICSNCKDSYAEETAVNPNNHENLSEVHDPAATCEKGGKLYNRCDACGYSVLLDVEDALGHSWKELYTVNPTCTEGGYTIEQCETCKNVRSVNPTDATGHDWKKKGIVVSDATCAADGLTEYSCKNCGDKKYEAISATGHTPGAAATCTEPQTCTECGAILELPTGHHYSEAVTVPTCTSMGYTTFTCDGCGISYVGNYTDKIEHHYHSVITPATCTELGFTTYTCTECGDSYKSDYVDKKPHAYNSVVTPATCTAMGFTTYTCPDCGDSYVADYTDVLPHNYTKQVIAPTCTSQGYTIYTCPDCGKEFIGDEKESIEHNYTEAVTAPTCTEMGFSTFTCNDCEYSYVSKYVDALGHDYIETVTAPTCTELGFSTFNCSRCDASYIGNEKDKLPHDYNAVVTAPTCTTMGYTTFTCNDCDETYVGDYTDPAGHSYVMDRFAPTCTEMGMTFFTCTVCGHTEAHDYEDALGHDYVGVSTAPTCTELGYTTYTCSRCGDSYVGDEKEIGPHDYEITVTAPTCTEMGYSTAICKVCGHSETRDYTDALGHQYTAVETPATCTELGFTTYTCAVCSDSYKGDEAAALGHAPSGWIVDVPATIESEGHRYIKCEACDITLKEETIEKLTDSGHTNEEGMQTVGSFDVTVTDKDGKPVFDSVITIDGNNNITVELPDGRIITADDKTTVTVRNHDTKTAAENINILVKDIKGNNANGVTNAAGQLTVPNYSSNAGSNDVVTDNVNTFVVIVTDKYGNVIPNCGIKVGENYVVDVYLPQGTAMDDSNRLTVTVVNEKSEPYKDLDVIVIGENDNIERGKTNVNGQVTVPYANRALTDRNGIANVGGYIVKVENEPKSDRDAKTPIKNALVTLTEDNKLLVKLPDGRVVIDFDNRTTVTVTDTSDKAVKDMEVNVYSSENEEGMTEKTNRKGQVTVPPWNMDVVPTAPPNATATPKPDFEPTAKPDFDEPTPTPNATQIPDTTQKPGETVAPTQKPGETTAPTQKPGETAAPTQKPGETAAPTQKPDATKIPTVTAKPDETTKPHTTIAPTQKPDATKIPTVTAKPTTEPGQTDKPVTPTQKPNTTQAPTVTDKPGTTTAPTQYPSGTDIPVIIPTDDPNATPTPKPASPSDYFVTVTDNDGTIGGAIVIVDEETGAVRVELPDGKDITPDNRIVTTVTNKNTGEPVIGIPVTVADKNGNTVSDLTNTEGKAIVPPISSDLTDINGDATVTEGDKIYHVNVSNEKHGNIANALIKVENGEISVALPSGRYIDYKNRTTVNVSDNDYAPMNGVKVTVSDNIGTSRTEATNVKGDVIVPPLNEDIHAPGTTTEPGATDEPIHVVVPVPTEDPNATQAPTPVPGATQDPNATPAPTETPKPKYDKYDVVVTDKDGIVDGALVVADENGNITVVLPDGNTVNDYDNRITVAVTSDGQPCEGVKVKVNDNKGGSRTEATDNTGKVTVPPLNEDKSDKDGSGNIINKDKDYNVTVKDETGAIPGADIVIDETGKVTVTLPDDKTLTPDNVVTIVVTDKDDKPVADVPVTVVDKNGNKGDDKTNGQGIALAPVSDEDYTDKDGHGIVGAVDKDGNVLRWNVTVENEKDGKIDNAHIVLKDGKISVILPDGKTLSTINKTTVTVTDKDGQPVNGMSVTISDATTTKSSSTDKYGKVTLPKSSSGGGGGGGSSSGGGGGSYFRTGYTVTVTDKDGKTVNASKSNVKDGSLTLTLPKGYTLDDNYYTVTVKDTKGNVAKDVDVTVKTKDGKNSVSGETDKNGIVVLPAVKHAAYVIGYEDGEFKPEGSMTRAEAAAIFARNIAERKGDTIRSNKNSFNDVKSEDWFAGYVSYLEKFDVINGYQDGTFRPQDKITRAEFVTMCTRFYKLFGSVSSSSSNSFTDAPSGHWAFNNINSAVAMEWINGYSDGTFRPDNNITRAEVVTIVNRVTERKADTEYINKNTSKLESFTDLKDKTYWAYTDILEAANEHTANEGSEKETWISVK